MEPKQILRAHRKRLKLSQREFAIVHKVSRETIRNYEVGKCRVPGDLLLAVLMQDYQILPKTQEKKEG